MPVLRKREQARPLPNGSVIGATPSPIPGQLAGMANRLASRAADYARVLAQEAQERGVRLAKAAVLSEDENGMPRLPADPTAEMGRLAQKAYDSTMQDRYGHLLAQSVKYQIDQARSANLYDADAFEADARERVAGMRENLPDGMAGVFDDTVDTMIADGGAQIGREQARVQLQDDQARVRIAYDDAANVIIEQVELGRDDRAQMLLEENIKSIEATNPNILSAAEKRQTIDRLVAKAGMARMMRDLGLREDASVGELTDLAARLNDPVGGGELHKYFLRPGEDRADPEILNAAANLVQQFLGNANMRENAQASRDETAYLRESVARGQTESTARTRAALDANIAAGLGLRDESGAARQIGPGDWVQMADRDRARAMAAVKTAGFIPASLDALFRQAWNSRDAKTLAAVFPLYRDLQEAPNQKGISTSLTGDLNKDLVVLMETASSLHGDGAPSQESIQQAMDLIQLTKEQPWGDDQLADAMNRNPDFFGAGGWLRGGKITKESARDQMRKAVVGQLFEDIEATPREKQEAVDVFEMYLRMEGDPERAMDMTRQSMEGRFVETDVMLNVSRSSYAPEKHYATPPSRTMAELIGRGGEWLKNAPVDFLEWNLNIGLLGWIFDDFELGGNATPFERMASAEVNRMLAEQGIDFADQSIQIGTDFLEAGRDFKLTPARDGFPPVYRVTMIDRATGRTYPLSGTFDINPEWNEFVRFDRKLMEERGKRIGEETRQALEATR